MNAQTTIISVVVLAAASSFVGSLFGQGTLTPPGSPGPTMKSLDQIEARTPVSGPAPITIAVDGSYYLTQNISAVGQNAIVITAAHVTIDLNGFELIGDQTANHNGISVNNNFPEVTIQNGAIQNFGGSAIRGLGAHVENVTVNGNGNGIQLSSDARVIRCHARDNSGVGIEVGNTSIVRDCVATDNGTSGIETAGACTIANCTAAINSASGIVAGVNCTVADCVANENGPYGIHVGAGCTLHNCSAYFNLGPSGTCGGIQTDDNCVLSNCSSTSNSLSQGTQSSMTGFGFSLGSNCVMTNCVAGNNTGDGIAFVGNCLITGNNSTGNSFAGFHAIGSVNRIDGNMASGNGGAGIAWTNDLVVRNTSFLNSPNYSPAVGVGNTGPVQAASNASNPFANF
jgi:hypothetical protein